MRETTYSKAVNTQEAFVSVDGQRIRNLIELARFLSTASNEIFTYHVNDTKNDFHNWIRDCIDNKELAEEVLLAGKDKKMCELSILRKIVGELT